MEMKMRLNLWWLLPALLAVILLVALVTRAGSFLVIDEPHRSDVILVLAGETNHRPERALQLQAQGFGQRILLDVPTNSKIYEFTQIQLAQKYIQDLPEGATLSICPIDGLSTRDETKDVERCLIKAGAERVLIVTSDFHTRRALSTLRREIPGHQYSVAASRDEEQFGVRWWIHRQWAKTFVDEWLRLIWWKGIDQWR
jgi:DUF218 domain